MSSTIEAIWDEAAATDPTLQVSAQDLSALRRKRLRPTLYSRSQMFERMGRGEVSLFSNLPVPVQQGSHDDLSEALVEGIRSGFPPSQTACIQKGKSGRRCRMKVPEVIRLWEGGRAILSVTDLHFRRTKFDTIVDTSRLSDFNILCHDPEYSPLFKRMIEMMTLVVSSARNLTDNHADDCDGTNHCFVGRKLWLAWDRMEGESVAFQDVDRDRVFDQASFDMQAFLSLPSSRWFTVEPRQTLFLPGSMAHKVVTLEHYIGVGSFNVALPSYLRCLERWINYDTHDIIPKDLLGQIHKAVMRKLSEIQRAHRTKKDVWGVAEMKRSVVRWARDKQNATKVRLLQNSMVAEFVRTALRT